MNFEALTGKLSDLADEIRDSDQYGAIQKLHYMILLAYSSGRTSAFEEISQEFEKAGEAQE